MFNQHAKKDVKRHFWRPSLVAPLSRVHQNTAISVHKLNLLLMTALLTRRGDIHSLRPATSPSQISQRKARKDTE